MQIDGKNRVNIVWVGSESTGIGLQGSKFIGDMSAVKVVCHSDTNKIHGYPIQVSELNTAICVQCGRPIPYKCVDNERKSPNNAIKTDARTSRGLW